MTFSTFGPPSSFPIFPPYLRICYWEGQFWVYDREGWLCSTQEPQTVIDLLMANAREAEPDRPYFVPNARELIYPGSALAKENRQFAIQRATSEAAQQLRCEREAKAKRPAPPKLRLADLLEGGKLG